MLLLLVGFIIFSVSGNAESATNTNGNFKVLSGRDLGAGIFSDLSSILRKSLHLLNTPPSEIRPWQPMSTKLKLYSASTSAISTILNCDL